MEALIVELQEYRTKIESMERSMGLYSRDLYYNDYDLFQMIDSLCEEQRHIVDSQAEVKPPLNMMNCLNFDPDSIH